MKSASSIGYVVVLCFIVSLGLTGNACSGSSTPSAPSGASGSSSGSGGAGGSGGSNQACRTYPTAATATSIAATGTSTLQSAIAPYNASTNQLTVTSTLTAPFGCTGTGGSTSGTQSSLSTWNSVADFIAEISVIPPLERRTRLQQSSTTNCGSGSGTTTFTYDGQQRLTRRVSETTQTGATVSTTTFTPTAWDSAGRPTAATVEISTPPQTATQTQLLAYDDARRTLTTTLVIPGAPDAVSTTTFDANGNNIRVESEGFTATATILSTATICR